MAEDRFQNLNAVRDAVLKDAFVIHVVTTDRLGGYRLFSVLNDRGSRLTVTDLLRSHTLEQLASFPTVQDKAAKEWDGILEQSGLEVDNFLRAYYPSLTGRRASRDALFDAFVAQLFLDKPLNQGQATGLLDKLILIAKDFRTYTSIRRGQWPYQGNSSQVTTWQRDRLRRLSVLLKHELALPLLLAVYSTASEGEFAEIVHKVELFAFRYKNICDGHASAPANAYYRAAKKARDGVPGWRAALLADLRGLLNERADDSRFRADLKDLLSYDAPSQRANIRELLTTLEDYWGWLRNPSGSPKYQGSAVIDVEQIQIEHIYPQNPQPPYVDLALGQVADTLGNLTFWDPHDNKAAGNLPFDAKKNLYKNSRIRMTQILATLPQWDLHAVNKRLGGLLDDACKIFVV